MNALHTARRPQLSLEPLEDRALAAAGLRGALGDISTVIPTVSATLNAGVLRINGTYFADTISVRQANGMIRVGGIAGGFAAVAVTRIEVNGFGRNDTILLNSEVTGGQPILKPCTVHGGAGDDTIFGGYGSDTLHGDAGNDTIFASKGNDILVGGEGMDRLFGGAGNDWLSGDVADAILAGQADSDVIAFTQMDPAALVNYNEAMLKTALGIGLAGMSFSRSNDGEKISVKNFKIEDVTIENGITRLHLKADIRYQKTRGLTQFSVSGTLRFSVTPQLDARFFEGTLTSATVMLADPHVKEVNLSNVPNWLDNSSEMRNFLETKLAAQPPIDLTATVQTFLVLGGGFGPTIAV